MAKSSKNRQYCMFCGRPEDEVSFLLQGLDACICAECVKLAGDYLDDFESKAGKQKPLENVESKHKPKDIHAFLWNQSLTDKTTAPDHGIRKDIADGRCLGCQTDCRYASNNKILHRHYSIPFFFEMM